MRRPLLATAAVLTLTVLIPSPTLAHAQSNQQNEPSAQESAPDVPDAIAVPAGQQVQFFVTAKGSQIYTCQASADGKFGWTLKGPEAELRDRKDKVIGQHFADPTTKLPTWKLKDGSEVSGKAAAHVDSLDSNSIPWLPSESRSLLMIASGARSERAIQVRNGQPRTNQAFAGRR